MRDSRLTDIGFHLDGIAHVLRDRPLRVPAYQRSYAWREEEVAAFWWDLRAAMTGAGDEYFLGTIVLTRDESNGLAVIDGQQRLATTSLLIAAIRDVFVQAGDEQRAAVIERDYLATRDLRTSTLRPKLELNRDDADYYAHSVLKATEPPARALASHRRIADAYAFLNSQVQSDADAAGTGWAERLFDWLDFLDQRVRVIVIDVPSEADAFLIFETLNDRGLALTIADLLKNYFLGLARQNANEVETRWLSMVAAFDADQADEIATSYIRHYWASLNGPTRERELYRSIRARVRGPEQAEELVRDLDGSSPLYAALLDPSHEKWRELGVAQPVVDTVLRFGLEQPRPLLLACMQEFEQGELNRLLRHLVSWLVRGIVAGSIGGGTTERAYANAARAVRRRDARGVGAVFDVLSPIIPSDEEFTQAFAHRRITQPKLAKYLLLCIENEFSAPGSQENRIVGLAEEAGVSLDRVIPRGAQDGWEGFPTTAGSFTRIGNQVLLPFGETLGRTRDWMERRGVLASAGRPLARAIANYPTWNVKNLDEHQAALAKLAAEVWSLRGEAAGS